MENLFENINEIKDITGWKVLSVLKKDDFNLTDDELLEINRIVPFNIMLKTNEEYWITNFYIKVMNIGVNPLDNVILVSPECPEQYINFEELRKDILEPLKELIKEEYLSGMSRLIKTTMEEYMKSRVSQMFDEGLGNTYYGMKDFDWGNIAVNNVTDNTIISTTTTSTDSINDELLNNLRSYNYVGNKL